MLAARSGGMWPRPRGHVHFGVGIGLAVTRSIRSRVMACDIIKRESSAQSALIAGAGRWQRDNGAAEQARRLAAARASKEREL